jgi:hypothetical protein
MWSSWVKRRDTTQVMYIAKLKDGPKRVKKTFLMILERVFEMVWWRGRKWNHIKKDFWSWSIFLLSKYWLLLLFEETFAAFLFSFFLSCSVSWGLRGFDDIWGENHFFKNFFSDGFNILAVDAYSGMELCMPTWLIHDYRDGGVVDILVVNAYSRVEVCTPIFLGGVSKKNSRWQIIFKKISKLKWTHPSTKLNTNKSYYMDNIWLW